MRRLTTSILFLLLAGIVGMWAPDRVMAAPSSGFPLLQEQEQDTTEAEEQEEEEQDTITKYTDVITEDAITTEGLFKTHMIKEKLYYEIPLDMLEREMMLLTRIARTPGGAGYGGSKVNTSTVRWQKNDERIFLRLVSYQNVADDTTAIAGAVRNSNFEPILQAFDIEVMSEDSAAAVIEVTGMFTSDMSLLGLASFQRNSYGVRRLDGDRTYIVRANAYPRNVEVRRVVTYEATSAPSNSAGNTMSMEMHHSMLLLPDDPMEPRMCDERVGFFSTSQTDFGLDVQRAESLCFITRWRLEPSDPEAYARGELVDPVNPIVYYIDPATPPKWVPLPHSGCGGLAGRLRGGRVQQRHRGPCGPHRRSRLEPRGRALLRDPLSGLFGAERLRPARARPAHRRDPRERHPVVPQRDEPAAQLVLHPDGGGQ